MITRHTDGFVHVVPVSGGKDSSALALHLKEAAPRPYTYIYTPAGDELPEVDEYLARLEQRLEAPIIRITAGTLDQLIEEQNALPSWRMRWCTRRLKIEPALAFYAQNAPCTAYVGIRADEEQREGIYGSVPQRFPLQEWGWGVEEVWNYLQSVGMIPPIRTNCGRCYDQRVSEWEQLYWYHRDVYESAQRQEEKTGHTFRSPQRDSKPTALKDLREYFNAKGKPAPATHRPLQLSMARDLSGDDYEPSRTRCRVCSL